MGTSNTSIYISPTSSALFTLGDSESEDLLREGIAGNFRQDYPKYRSEKLDFLFSNLPRLLEDIVSHYDRKNIIAERILSFYAQFWDLNKLFFRKGNQSFWMNLINLLLRFGGMNPISHGRLDLKTGSQRVEYFRDLILSSNPNLESQFRDFKEIVNVDFAMMASIKTLVEQAQRVGGIDLNNLNMKTSGEATQLNVATDKVMIQPIKFLTPKILHIGDVNVYQFLGLNVPNESDSSSADFIPELSFIREE